MNCAKHNVKGVDSDNQCPLCEAEPRCFNCVHFRVPGGIMAKAECELKHNLEPLRCGAYMREIGSEG
jgi:hypothetical protein